MFTGEKVSADNQLTCLYMYKLLRVKYCGKESFGNPASHTGHQIQEDYFVAFSVHPVLSVCSSKWIYY